MDKEMSNDKNKKSQSGKGKKGNKKGKGKSNVQTLPSFDNQFNEWFNEIIFQAGLLDYRYNLKGCGVWLAYGFKLRRYMLNIIRDLLESTPIPHDEYLFPLLVPEPQFMKEAEHVKGFEEEVYWVKDGGTTPLDIKLALRPTSETVIYPMMALWIRSHQDLPLKTYQIVNTFRYEGKNTRPLIRVREITTFKEAHTCHATSEEATEQIIEALDAYKGFFDALDVPYIITKRPKWDTFPGAEYTIAFDCIFPGRHRALQIGTVHNLGQTFAKTFDITFETVDGKQDLVYQTCYGISERAVAAVIASHGDNFGLKLPPNIAPIQIVIVPIVFKKKEKEIRDACKVLYDELKKANYRVHLDERDISSGRKFYKWEMKGVPLRLELGPKDLEKKQVCLVRRDTREKQFIPQEELLTRLPEIFNDIQASLGEKAREKHQSWILKTIDLEEALNFIEENKGIAEIPFCGEEECAAEVEKRIDGLKFLGIPFEYLSEVNPNAKEETDKYCAHCMKPVKHFWRIGRSY